MSAALPPLYDRWIAGLLGVSVASEPRATCLDCAMRPGNSGDYEPFSPETKCCTFTPNLTNFAAGGIIGDGDTAAARWIADRIARGVGVTPLGIGAPGIERTLYLEGIKVPTVFGHALSLRCPFYIAEGGLCGIHRHREAVCSTWFCKFERGPLGHHFWTALKNVLRLIERNLARHCILALDVGDAALLRTLMAPAPLDEKELERRGDEPEQRRRWGKFHGREREFFVGCAELVGRLEWRDVLGIGGVELAAHARVLGQMHGKLQRLPKAVIRGTGLVQLSPTPGMARLHNQSVRRDHADVPKDLLAHVGKLVGRPLDVAMAELREQGIAVDDAFVRALYDWQVLVAVQDNA